MRSPIRKTGVLAAKTRGQTIVEFALILPVLLLILYGLLEVGRLIFVYSIVVTASREAVRYGSATGLNVGGGVLRYNDCAGIRAAAQSVDFLDAFADADITITYDNGPSTADYATCPAGAATGGPTAAQIRSTPMTRIKVQVSGAFSPLAAIVPLNPLTITSSNARTIISGVLIMP